MAAEKDIDKGGFLYAPFESLGKALKGKVLAKAKKAVVKPLKKPPVVDAKSDDEAFAEAMKGVREIKEYREIKIVQPQTVFPRTPRRDEPDSTLRRIIEGKEKIRVALTPEYIEWLRPGLRGDITKKLHGGFFSVQDYMDLHGHTVSEAEEALRAFLFESLHNGFSCVKVIHGRGLRSPGEPVLKEAVRKWLERPLRKWVFAYATARDCDGGPGATYILLKGSQRP